MRASTSRIGLAAALLCMAAPPGLACAQAAAPAAPDQAIIDRLNALEARVRQLEARNAQLEAQAAAAPATPSTAAVAPPAAAPSPPVELAKSDAITIKPRGVFQIDYTAYRERAGGYDYSNGTDIRRARFGFEGTAGQDFKWKIEAEFVKNQVNLLDAYLTYAIDPHWSVTVGQHKAPFALESNTSDSYNTFLERGMANGAFGAVGAERRTGISLAYQSTKLNAAAGLFGSSEAVTRNATTPDEAYGANARITWDPVLQPGRIVHLGLAAFHATNFAGNTLTIGDRPNVRVDDGRIISVTIPGSNPAGGPQTGARSANFIGTELVLVHGPFSIQGEYDRLSLDRFGSAPNADFSGGYVFGSWFLTGEARSIKNGNIDRLKPIHDFDPRKGQWGAIEVAARYDFFELTDVGLSPLSRKATSLTGALNWYLNPRTKILFNYIRFKGTNSPLVVAPVSIFGTTAKGDALATRLQFDF